MNSGDVIELEITDVAFGGDGVARHEGRVVFVPFVVKGDRVAAKVVKKSGQFARAEVQTVIAAGAGRCEPRCRYFTNCGGCQYQHMTYETQLAVKSKQLHDTLARIGGINSSNILPWIKSPQEYGYRNRISVHQERGSIGFRACDGRSLVDISNCPLASEEVNTKLKYLRQHPGRREHYSLREEGIPELGFYQVNRFLLNPFRDKVAELCLQEKPEEIIECYGGSGFFTAQLAAANLSVTMIESDSRLVAEAKAALPDNVKIAEGVCEEILPDLLRDRDAVRRMILIDPPREGLSAVMRDLLTGNQAGTLVYVSCNPATLARDLKALKGQWEPKIFQPIDLFPQTAHFECVVVCSHISA